MLDPDNVFHGAERWFYGGEPPPGDATERTPPPGRTGPAPIREPDERRVPPVREPRPVQSWSDAASRRMKA